jgi:hypothetical protein
MRDVVISIAALLLAAARMRAETVMQRYAKVRVHQDGSYTSNAGGWN